MKDKRRDAENAEDRREDSSPSRTEDPGRIHNESRMSKCRGGRKRPTGTTRGIAGLALTGVKKNRQDEQDFQDEQDAELKAIEGALQFVLGVWTKNARLTTIPDLHPVTSSRRKAVRATNLSFSRNLREGRCPLG